MIWLPSVRLARAEAEVVLGRVGEAADALAVQADGHAGGLGDRGGPAEGEQAAGFVRRQARWRRRPAAGQMS